VRIARQVSHRNVCRVHDIGDTEGLAFLSMEYIDGDNLATLLQQVGRLPSDKALEFARKLCAGLSAAHEKGVLHRDLKPANIMIDRRGQLLITDFGLAAAADAIPGTDIRSGTPAYMSPEQKDGSEVTVRSDIYSLGLVLAEMFTGQKDTKTSSAVKDLDPAIDRVIQRCLVPDPSKRPDSAITVARMLPGGDPLAEALAAGETPTPGMVAASDDTGTLSVKWAVACMLFVALGLAAAPYLGGKASIMGKTPLPYPPTVLMENQRSLAVRLGYPKQPVAESGGFIGNGIRLWAVEKLTSEAYRAQLAAAQPGEVSFLLRQRFSKAETRTLGIQAYPDSLVMLHDPQGRLVGIYTVPPSEDTAPGGTPDWDALVEAAELDPQQWTPTEPGAPPPVRFDERRAWISRYPYTAKDKIPRYIRLEAAAWKGRIVYFHRNGPWLTERLDTEPSRLSVIFFYALNGFLLLAVVVLGWQAHHTGRADVRGAARLAGFVMLFNLPSRLLSAGTESLQSNLGTALLIAALSGGLFFATEPFARRHWPQLLIGWTRVLRGEVRNALVGAHALVGVALGVGLGLFLHLVGIYAIRPGTPGLYSDEMQSLTIAGFSANLLDRASAAPYLPLRLLFLLVLCRALLRNTWLAAVVTVGISAFFVNFGSPAPMPIYIASVAQFSLMMLILTRFGVLPLAVGVFVSDCLNRFPLTHDFSSWYAVFGLLPVLLVAGIALWAFRTALGRRKLLEEATL
jgi:serine/threonine-protein kinase